MIAEPRRREDLSNFWEPINSQQRHTVRRERVSTAVDRKREGVWAFAVMRRSPSGETSVASALPRAITIRRHISCFLKEPTLFRRLRIVSLTALLIVSQLAAGPASAFAADAKSGTDIPISTTGRYVVEFHNRADLTSARSIEDFTARGQFVLDALRSTATTSQREALAVAKSLGVRATSYWLRNVMVVEATESQIARIAALRSVASVHPEKIYPLVEPIPADEAIAVAVGDPEWGVAKIGADQVWAEGILGSGVVVANVDTGVDYLHPALVNQYRGNNGDGTFDHNYNWWDPSGICGVAPCDNAGHGTHTMGTMVGGDGPGPFTPDIGVAPGAQWIAAKGCEDFGCSDSSLLSAGQFILAPTDSNGLNPDPAMRPDIVNNSWGGGPGSTFYLEIVQAWRAAGIIPVFASGNPGPFCGNGGSPGDYSESFSVGATDINDVIADFSGRGPSAFGKINPDVAAPGVDVNSSLPGGGYGVYSGTSMAAPHAAGTFALMLSAASELIGDVDSSTESMKATAMDIIDMSCGGDVDGDPNNVYGDGRIDAQAAVALVATGGTLVGSIADSESGDPITPAKVSADNGTRTFTASGAPDGTYKLFLPAGTYDLTASAFGYADGSAAGVEIVTDETITQDFSLVSLPRVTLSGHVLTAESGAVVPGATVEALGVPVAPVTADAAGFYEMVLPIGTYSLKASNGGCITSVTDSVTLDQDTTHDFGLVSKIDQFGHGCELSPQSWVDVSGKVNLKGDDKFTAVGMPVPFPFYGQSYRRVFVTSNGYVTFQRPEFASYFGDPIPTSNTPNNAIYPLWTDLVVDDASQVQWGIYRPDRRGPGAYVLEFTQMRVYGGTATVDFEVFLWSDGRIDTLYRNNAGAPGDGSTSTIGIENAGGTDAFRFSYQEASLREDVGYRYLVVPTGFAGGVVTNANDGLPVAGALVTAQPSGTFVATGEDGSYSIRLVPGDHSLDVSAMYYVGQSADVVIAVDTTTETNFALAAAVASLSTDSITAVTDPEVATSAQFDITNNGTVALEWLVKERDRGATPPDLPDAPAVINGYTRTPVWAKAPFKLLKPTTSVQFAGPYETLITDPIGDAVGPVDASAIRGGADSEELGLAIDFVAGTPMNQIGGYIFLDSDQNAATGLSAPDLAGLEAQDVGVEYFVDMFASAEGVAYVVETKNFNLVAVVPVVTTGNTMTFAIPLESIGGDGSVNLAAVLGDFNQPTDWLPDEGHGSIVPFIDAPWMSADATEGILEPGETTTVTVTLGGPGFTPAAYVGDLAVVANDPRNPVQLIDVSLTVGLPESFGSVAGTITNSRAGFPVPGMVTVAAEWDGAPFVVSAQADDVTGKYLLFAPEGTWPMTVEFGGYQSYAADVTITAQHKTTSNVELAPLWANATVTGGPIDMTVASGASATTTLTLSNSGGLVDLDYQVFEVAGSAQVSAVPTAKQAASPSNVAPAGWVTRAVTSEVNGGSVAVFMDALPWGSDALLQVLGEMGAVYDVYTSADMATVNLSAYEAVFMSNDQSQDFYDSYTANSERFTTYVSDGGFLWLGAAAWGWNGGDFTGGVLPGGVTVDQVFEDLNWIAQPDHPAMADVANPWSGTAASHAGFSNIPEGSTVAFGDFSGQPTMVDYEIGAGRVLAVGQTLEFAWLNGQGGAIILPNSVQYAIAFEPFSDVLWLSEEPAAGSVAPDGSVDIVVTVDASELSAGTYTAVVVILTNDPLNPSLKVPVTLTVTG